MRFAPLLLVLLGCPRHGGESDGSTRRITRRASTTDPIVLPADAPRPETLPGLPARRGVGDATSLQSFAASQEIFTVEASLPVLGTLGADEVPRLRAALEADPRWRVGRWEDHLVAWRRCRADTGEWTASWAGYCANPTEEWRVMLVLDGPPPPEADPIAGGRFHVRAGPSQPDGWRSGTLQATGPAVGLEIHERSTNLELQHTATTLMTLDAELASLLKSDAPGPGAWVWAGVPGMEALTGERIRGEAGPPRPLPPGMENGRFWIQWDGERAKPLPVDGA